MRFRCCATTATPGTFRPSAFFASRRRHTRYWRDWSSDVWSSDLGVAKTVRLPDPKGLKGRVGRTDIGYGGVVITGSTAIKRVSGAAFRQTVNGLFGREVMKSTLFTVRAASAPAPAPTPPPAPTPSGSVCPPATTTH